jgi:hypothetical protein
LQVALGQVGAIPVNDAGWLVRQYVGGINNNSGYFDIRPCVNAIAGDNFFNHTFFVNH